MVYFILAFVIGVFAIIGCVAWAVVEQFKNKKANIAIVIVLAFIIINIVALVIIKNGEQKKFEEAFIEELESEIQEFKTEHNPKNITYDVTFNGKEDVHIVYHIDNISEEYFYISYYSLFPSVSYESMSIISPYVRSYGDVYVDGELKYSEEKVTIDKDSERCNFCDKSYSDRENVKSINRTGMCSQCYKNYKYAYGS